MSPAECAERAQIAYARVSKAFGQGSAEAARAWKVLRYWEEVSEGES